MNLVIADRTYRVRINPADEEVVRKTAKTINDVAGRLQTLEKMIDGALDGES